MTTLAVNPTIGALIMAEVIKAWPVDAALDLTCERCGGNGEPSGAWAGQRCRATDCNGSGTLDRITIATNDDDPIDMGEWRVSHRLVDGTASPYAVGPNSKTIDLAPVGCHLGFVRLIGHDDQVLLATHIVTKRLPDPFLVPRLERLTVAVPDPSESYDGLRADEWRPWHPIAFFSAVAGSHVGRAIRDVTRAEPQLDTMTYLVAAAEYHRGDE